MWFVRMFSLIRIVNLLSRKPPLSRKREASEALECETEMIIEGPSVQAVFQSVRRRPTPQSLPDKAVPEGMRGRAPPPPEVTLLQQTATWPGPPADLPAEVNEMVVEDQLRQQDGIEANPPWTASEAAPANRRRSTGIPVQTVHRSQQGRKQQWKLTSHGYSWSWMLCVHGRQGTVNSTPHTSPFSRSQGALIMMCDTTLAQVLVRVTPSMCHAPE